MMADSKISRNVMWNVIGSLVYYFSQWLMTVLVVRVSDYSEAGILALAMSVSTIIGAVSNYSVRNYQVADINNTFDHGVYVSLRLWTSFVSMVLLAAYLIVAQYSVYTTLSIISFMLIRLSEALIDVFQAIFQKQWRMDIVGKSLIIRGIVSLAVFGVIEYLFENIALTCFATALSMTLIAIFMDFLPCFRLNRIALCLFDRKQLVKLFLSCTPLFLNSLMANLIPNFPKIIGEQMLGEEIIGYYASVTTPAIIVQLISSYCFSSLIPMLAEQYSKKSQKIYSVICKIQLLIIAVGLLAVIGFSVLGDWILVFVFGENILPYSNLLMPAVVVSVLTATVYYICTLFTVVERNKALVASQLGSVLLVFALSQYSLNTWGVQGINYIMILSYLYFIVVGYIVVFRTIKRRFGKEKKL